MTEKQKDITKDKEKKHLNDKGLCINCRHFDYCYLNNLSKKCGCIGYKLVW